MVRIPVNTPSHSYEAVIEHGILSRAGSILKELLTGTPQLFIVTVAPVRRRWGKVLTKSLDAAGFSAKIIEMPDGERHLARLHHDQEVLDALAERFGLVLPPGTRFRALQRDG